MSEFTMQLKECEANPGMLELITNGEIQLVYPQRCFPQTDPDHFIALSEFPDMERTVLLIEDPSRLPKESAAVLKQFLAHNNDELNIMAIISVNEKRGVIDIRVMTDQGERRIHVSDATGQIREVGSGHYVIQDTSEMRYRIRNIEALDRLSRKRLDQYIG